MIVSQAAIWARASHDIVVEEANTHMCKYAAETATTFNTSRYSVRRAFSETSLDQPVNTRGGVLLTVTQLPADSWSDCCLFEKNMLHHMTLLVQIDSNDYSQQSMTTVTVTHVMGSHECSMQ